MKTSVIGRTVVLLERVASTNNYATSQVRENEVEEGTVFLAVNQTSGRGQQSNRWESEDGKNLTFSIVLHPDFLEIKDQFLLSKAVCLGIDAFLRKYVDQVSIKWPNDIYVGNKKICGILIENAIMNGRFSSSVVGIGLNINQATFVSDAPNPVSLFQLTGQTFDLKAVLQELLEQIDRYYCQLIDGNVGEINRLFEAKLFRLNSWHTFRDENHEYRGRIIGVNEIGQLKVEEESGLVNEYHFKEVSYLI
ncbi:biotin--[acetyl-CoA-carboxylase] ligase [Mangrovibacterium marinum]|uniref:BirA family biotin operon repressor/biotin-[acetyl-CoA-carboxylase] ligase n=1 Tax=Mangrovibacterium marinum TaxID=1639118 RepID=A0A2T5C5Y2_9BACT|nr:biotin--[acetyl-CoA-carboxylase] ligase [Mangrovibacterium marinum]PTN10303.1 BirA family biotin operon repressor/biotin-[acetyl-CoA-carboxylase] ligase [Mangrovibacterium marinum]